MVGLILVLGAPACAGEASGTGTQLAVDGVATTGSGIVPVDPGDPTPPIPDPSDAIEVDISGSVDCNGEQATGTGSLSALAPQICAELPRSQGLLAQLENTDDQVCAEIYGGPQRATIKGTINDKPVDVSVDRSDSCGIEAWASLEWLLGPAER